MTDLFYHIGNLNNYFTHNPDGHQYYEYQETDYNKLPDDQLISSSSNILQDLDKGTHLFDVELMENTILSMCPDEKHWKANAFILRNPRKITLSEIKKLVNNGSNPNVQDDLPLVLSAKVNQYDWLKYFHQECFLRLDAWDNMAVKVAKKNSYYQILEYLINYGEGLEKYLDSDEYNEPNEQHQTIDHDLGNYHQDMALLQKWCAYTAT